MKKIQDVESVVADRLSWLEGHKVRVRVSFVEPGQLSQEVFEGEYTNTLPMGREYFFVFKVSGHMRLVRTSSVLEMFEL